MFELRSKFHWSLFLRVQLTISQHWFRLWLGADQATSHYLNQWWLDYRRIYASLNLNELKCHFLINIEYYSSIAYIHRHIYDGLFFLLCKWISISIVQPIKYAHGFVVRCAVVVISSYVNIHVINWTIFFRGSKCSCCSIPVMFIHIFCFIYSLALHHDDVIKRKHFPRYWPFVRGIHRSGWIPRTKASDAELWCFIWSAPD